MNSVNRIPHAEIQAEHIRTLFRPTFITIIIAHIITGAFLVFVLWDTAPHTTLLTWLAILYSLTAVRWCLIRAYKRRPPATEAAIRWGTATVVIVGLYGVVRGGAAILFLNPEQPASLIIITLILLGIVAGGTAAFSSYPRAYIALAVPILLALTTVLLLHGGKVEVIIAILLVLNLVINLIYIGNVYRVLDESLRLRFENIALRRETEEKSALLETTLQNMRQGISVVDRDGRLRLWNQRFLDLLGLGHRHVDDHQPLDTVLQAADPPLPELSRARLEYRRSDGAVIEVLQNAMPDGDQVLTYTDISDLKRREEALEQANAAKTRFLATASHDLRQPIHALGLFFATLAEQVGNFETTPLLKQIEDSIDTIDAMLNAFAGYLQAGCRCGPSQGRSCGCRRAVPAAGNRV